MAVAAVQAAGGLVGQHHRWGVHQGPADGHPLLLASGELVGQVGPAVLKPQELQ